MTSQLLVDLQPDLPAAPVSPPSDAPSARSARAGGRPAAAEPKREARQLGSRALVLSTALTILGAVLLGGVAEVTVLGGFKHARAQAVHYGQLREQLAKSVAPVGVTDADGVVLPLGAPVAILSIPALHLREVVGQGTTSGVLIDGPGLLRSSAFPGQAGTSAIYGRQAGYGGPFGSLADLRPGDSLSVTTGQGAQLYRVLGQRKAGDPVPPLRAGASRLVLVAGTGTAFAPNGVLRIDADLVSPVQSSSATAFPAASLTAAERPMSGDRAALVPLLLWAQALLLAALLVTYLLARWGRIQTWAVAIPVLLVVGLQVADQAARLLPNLL